jgi:hypothetical protein
MQDAQIIPGKTPSLHLILNFCSVPVYGTLFLPHLLKFTVIDLIFVKLID